MLSYLYVFLISMLPFIELRGSIPVGIITLHLSPLIVFIVAVVGNMVPVPFILIFLGDIEKYLRKYPKITAWMDKIFTHTRKKSEEKVRKWEYLALVLFVAVPLPGTGAWTGSLIAYLFNKDVKISTLMIFIGVLIAGVIVLALTLGANSVLP